MTPQLLQRREAAADRHDRALARFPSREGVGFQRELRKVIDELKSVLVEAGTARADAEERARTLSWLASAYFDLAAGKEPSLLALSAQCYTEAERVLEGVHAPLTKAKITFNFANTLRGQSQGENVDLMEAAKRRYQQAAALFRELGERTFAEQADYYLQLLEPQLALAREAAGLGGRIERLDEMKDEFAGADVLQRDELADELARMKRGGAGVTKALSDAVAMAETMVENHPDLFKGRQGQLQELRNQVGQITTQLDQGDEGRSDDNAFGLAMMKLLERRLESDAGAGTVEPQRAQALRRQLEKFGRAMSEGGDSLSAQARRVDAMRQLAEQTSEFAQNPSYGSSGPSEGSRAAALLSATSGLKQYLFAESTRADCPDRGTAGNLLTELVTHQADLHKAGDDAVRVAALEPPLFVTARAIRRYNRLANVTLARPRWPSAGVRAEAKSVFVSGAALGDTLHRAAEERGVRLLCEPTSGVYGEERYNQLRSVDVGVFHLPEAPEAEGNTVDPRSTALAQTCYDLGVALALGLAVVVVIEPGTRIPFDVPVIPVEISLRSNAGPLLLDAIEEAAFGCRWGGSTTDVGRARERSLQYLSEHLADQRSVGTNDIAWRMAERAETPAEFVDNLTRLLSMIGGTAPSVLLPAWPPAYSAAPRCFHVTAFRDWSNATRDVARDTCERNGVEYARGDETEEQRILHAIWGEIARATHLLVDLTHLNPNVAVELGMAHTLGKRCRLVFNEDVHRGVRPEKLSFASIRKDQLHPYRSSDDFASLRTQVKKLVAP